VKVISLLDSDDKEAALRAVLRGTVDSAEEFATIVTVDLESLRAIPNSPFAYWVGPRIRELFTRCESFETRDRTRTAKCGLGTLDDFRFLRLGWECRRRIDTEDSYWRSYFHGGVFRRFYDLFPLVVNWQRNGAEVKAFVAAKVGSASRKVQSAGWYFRPGFVFPRRTRALAPKVMPAGGIFSTGGQAGFVPVDDLLASISILNSSTCSYLVALSQGRTGDAAQYEVGQVQRMPWVSSRDLFPRLAALGRLGWSLQRSLDTPIEVSHAFVMPAVLQVGGGSMDARADSWRSRVTTAEDALYQVQAEVDELSFELYGLADEERQAITERFGVPTTDDEDVTDEEAMPDELVAIDTGSLAAQLVSWGVGVCVGRFDVRFATGDRDQPDQPDPFDPLPVCSFAMVFGQGGPLDEPPDAYPLRVSPVLVHDPGHEWDVTARLRRVFEVVFHDDADAWWSDVGRALGTRSGEVSEWLATGFFDHHLKAYSQARRKAPVLWPLGTKSGSYLVWLYAQRVSADSLFQALHDVVAPKLTVEDRQLSQLRQTSGTNPSTSQRKAIEAQEHFVAELRELRDEIEALAPLWAPDLNDGTMVVLAPLWRLFAHHRVWSNELKRHWGKLANGDYDWAQLAMALWPERVVRKCAQDRSLAIAHGLEDVFWVQDSGNADKWHARSEPTVATDQLIALRHNPATSAVLQRIST